MTGGKPPYKVFISHTSEDEWVVRQMARRIKSECGAEVFLDVYNIAKGDHFDERIFAEIPSCEELVALLTPWSIDRNWVWVEIGAARALMKRVVGVFYGVRHHELDQTKGGMACLNPTNTMSINAFDEYLLELKKRVKDRGK